MNEPVKRYTADAVDEDAEGKFVTYEDYEFLLRQHVIALRNNVDTNRRMLELVDALQVVTAKLRALKKEKSSLILPRNMH